MFYIILTKYKGINKILHHNTCENEIYKHLNNFNTNIFNEKEYGI